MSWGDGLRSLAESRKVQPDGGYRVRPGSATLADMNPILLEAGLIALTALSFWLLDRYVAGCETI